MMNLKLAQLLPLLCLFLQVNGQHKGKATIHVLYNPNKPANIFRPSEVLGGAYDGHSAGDNKRILTDQNIEAMKSVGLKPVSYRLRTELGCEAWHWNEAGTWSEKNKHQGYWISDNNFKNDIEASYGYFLPRRGNTHDQANDDGYSRIDDGDTETFWKSNPYLDQYFTEDDNKLHPQWVIVDLGTLYEINALKVHWANPYALAFRVDYALDIGKDYFEPLNAGLWHDFEMGKVLNQTGKSVLINVSRLAVKARFVRIMMTESSYTSERESNDRRDSIGFAIKELEVGLLDEHGAFHDWVHHVSNKSQSTIHVSSTDPWHRAIDKDSSTEQAGIDFFFNAGLTSGYPCLMPVALLYDSPENMQALVAYLAEKKYPVSELEMGEEPEGQLIDPVDYATLYLQWAKKIKMVSPSMKLGGPGFAALAFTKEDKYTFTERKWTSTFLKYLNDHNSINSFNFFSTEWYPFDDICSETASQLAKQPEMMTIALMDYIQRILPPNTPIYLTEYGYSAYGGRPEVEIEGALMYADILGQFLTLGGKKSFLYGYEPAYLDQTNNCDWGNNMLFGMDENGKIQYRTAAYYGMELLVQKWAQPSNSELEIYPANGSPINKQGLPLIATYAIRKPNNSWSLAIINKDPLTFYNVTIDITNLFTKRKTQLHFPLTLYQYSGKEYHWLNNGGMGHPTKSLPPQKMKIDKPKAIILPPYSLTIIQEGY